MYGGQDAGLVPPTIKNQVETKMENEMETGAMEGYRSTGLNVGNLILPSWHVEPTSPFSGAFCATRSDEKSVQNPRGCR